MGLALVFAGGITCGLAIPCPTAAFILLASVALAAALLYRRTAWLVHAAIFLAGWIAADLEIRTPSPADVRRVLERDREYATAIGVVIADPAPAQGGTEPLWFVPLRLEGLRRAEAWQKVRGEVRVLWRYTAGQERPAYGDRWLVAGPFVVTTDKAQVQLYADPGAARRLGSGGGWRAMAWCLRGRERCAEILSRGIAGYTTEAGFIRAMMLGLREDLPDPVYRAFAETGTLHVVAISGTHIAVAALIFAALLRSTGLSQRYWIVVLAPMLVLYTLGTGMSASAVRACVMALVFWSSSFFLRRPDGPTALALSALIILAASPSQLADAGFLLSFGIVAGFMALYARIVRPIEPWWWPDPWRLQAEAWPVRGLRWAGRHVSMLLGASVVAWLVGTPLTAMLFHNVSPISVVANLIVIPLSSAMLMTGFLSLATGWCLPFVGEVFNHANRAFAWMVLRVVETFNDVPGGSMYLASHAWWWVAVWYVALAVIVLGQGRLRRVGVAGALAAVVFAVTLYATDRSARVSIFGTGRVAVALCDVPGGGDVLVNAGDAGVSRRVVRWLREQGVDRLGALVLAAPTADVAGGVPALLEQIDVEEIWIGPQPARSRVFTRALDLARERGIAIRNVTAGSHGRLAGGVGWEVLHPSVAGPQAIDGALVVRFARDASSVLIRSPAAASQEARILASAVEPTADVAVMEAIEPSEAWLRAAGNPVVVQPGAWEQSVVEFDDAKGAHVADGG